MGFLIYIVVYLNFMFMLCLHDKKCILSIVLYLFLIFNQDLTVARTMVLNSSAQHRVTHITTIPSIKDHVMPACRGSGKLSGLCFMV